MFMPRMTTLEPYDGTPRDRYDVITCKQCKKKFFQKIRNAQARTLTKRDKRRFHSPECYKASLVARAESLKVKVPESGEVDLHLLRRTNLRRLETPEERAISVYYKRLRSEAKRLHEPTMAMLNGIQGEIELKEVHGNRIRSRIASRMLTYLDIADAVITGQVKWTPVQARVFGMLLNKTTPDLSASYIKSESVTKPLTELSREELEMIASGVGKAMLEHRESDRDLNAISIPDYDKFESDTIDEEKNS